ncbi:MAG TPA: flagellin [Pirellulales bacterium]|jgi:flagellin|nr:flagellin [Pirellulales bacterium]
MTRINTNVSSLVAQFNLQNSNNQLQTSLTRLSTGLKINSGADDPAGLIESQTLGSEITSINASLTNAQQANDVVSTADAALTQVSNQLNSIRGLVQSAASKGTSSASEIAADQQQIDSSLQAIQQIAQTTIFGTQNLLNGSEAFNVDASGGSLGSFESSSDINISSFNPALHGSAPASDVSLAVTTAATQKTDVITGTSATSGQGLNNLSTNSTHATSTLLAANYVSGASTGLNQLSTASTHGSNTILGANYTAGATTGLNKLSTNSTKAVLDISGTGLSSANITTGSDGITLTITGDLGTATTASVTATAIQANSDALTNAINAISAQTGVTATGTGAAADITLTSNNVGAGATLSIVATDSAGAGSDQTALNAALGAVTAGTTGAATATTFTVAGNAGSANVTLANNDAVINGDVASLATLINTVSSQTGVTAAVNGSGNVVLTSAYVGTSSTASLSVATGGNAGDTSLLAGGTQTTTAGTTGAATATTFTVTGNTGSANITLANNDTVINGGASSLVTLINNVTAQTGVTASLNGSGNVVLKSGNVGTASTASIAVATGGNSNDTSLVSGATQTAVAGTTGAQNTTTIELNGDQGQAIITVNNDAVINGSSALVNAINAVTSQTGITASSTGGQGANVTLTSQDYGSAAQVSANAIASDNSADITTFNAGGTQAATAGVDVAGTVTTSLGSGSFTGTGANFSYQDANISLSGTTDPSLGTLTSNFNVTGGALFQLGPEVNYSNQVNVSLGSLDLSTLGRNITTTGNAGLSSLETGGSNQLSGTNLTNAAAIVDQAINQIATLSGQLGALQTNVLNSNISSLQANLEQVSSAQSNIQDANFASETANLTRAQILVQAGTSVLSIANSQPQNVLTLLQKIQ